MKICPSCGIKCSDRYQACPHDGTILHGSRSGDLDRLLGRVFDERWFLEEKLFESQLTVVYRARTVTSESEVVIKLLKPHGPKEIFDVEFLERFQIEAEQIQMIRGAYLVPIVDFGVYDGQAYLVSPFIKVPTLQALLGQDRKPPLQVAMEWGRKCAVALIELHQFRVIHRDLTPASMFVEGAEEGEKAKISIFNFGLARILGKTEDPAMTRTGRILGDPRYMSPEQLQGRHVDLRTDVYSLAVVTYQLLAGYLPFQAQTTVELIEAISKREPRSLPEMHLHPLEKVLFRALEKDPRKRQENAEQFLAEFSEAAGFVEQPIEQSNLLLSKNEDYAAIAPQIEEAMENEERELHSYLDHRWKVFMATLLLLGGFFAWLAYDLWQSGEVAPAIDYAATDEVLEPETHSAPVEPPPADELSGIDVAPAAGSEINDDGTKTDGEDENVSEFLAETDALAAGENASEPILPPGATVTVPPVASPAPTPDPPAVREPSPKEVKAGLAKYNLTKGWYVQVAAKETESEALQLKGKVEQVSQQAQIEGALVNKVFYYRVVAGPFDSRASAIAAKATFVEQKLSDDIPFVRLVE